MAIAWESQILKWQLTIFGAIGLTYSGFAQANGLAESLLPQLEYAFYLPPEDLEPSLFAQGGNSQQKSQKTSRRSQNQEKSAP